MNHIIVDSGFKLKKFNQQVHIKSILLYFFIKELCGKANALDALSYALIKPTHMMSESKCHAES